MNLVYTLFLAIVVLTVYGIYIAFGPPSKDLDDPIDDHDD